MVEIKEFLKVKHMTWLQRNTRCSIIDKLRIPVGRLPRSILFVLGACFTQNRRWNHHIDFRLRGHIAELPRQPLERVLDLIFELFGVGMMQHVIGSEHHHDDVRLRFNGVMVVTGLEVGIGAIYGLKSIHFLDIQCESAVKAKVEQFIFF